MVPESRRTSCDLLILVDEPAEAVVSFDLVDLGCCATGEWSCGSGLPQGQGGAQSRFGWSWAGFRLLAQAEDGEQERRVVADLP